MKYHFPVLVEQDKDDEEIYRARFPGLENVGFDAFSNSVDDAFEDARYVLSEFLYEKEHAGSADIPVPLSAKEVEIPNDVYFCMLEADTDWYRDHFVNMQRFVSNPFL